MAVYRIKTSGKVVEVSSEDLRFIKERWREVLRLRAEPNPKPLGEVARLIGVTQERVRQIQNAALRKIREGRAAEEERSRLGLPPLSPPDGRARR